MKKSKKKKKANITYQPKNIKEFAKMEKIKRKNKTDAAVRNILTWSIIAALIGYGYCLITGQTETLTDINDICGKVILGCFAYFAGKK